MARKINALAKYRLDKILSELEELQAEVKLSKIDDYNLKTAAAAVRAILIGAVSIGKNRKT